MKLEREKNIYKKLARKVCHFLKLLIKEIPIIV